MQRGPLDVALLRADDLAVELDPRAVGTGLLGVIEALSRDAPLLLAVDDGPWLDAASARLLTVAFRPAAELDARLIVTVRTGEAQSRVGLSYAQLERENGAGSIGRLQLGPFSLAAIHELVLTALGTSIARPVLVKIHGATGADPFVALGSPAPSWRWRWRGRDRGRCRPRRRAGT